MAVMTRKVISSTITVPLMSMTPAVPARNSITSAPPG
jgi:hypothetical protein